MREHNATTFLRRVLKTAAWFFTGMLVVIILVLVALQFPAVQHYLAAKAFSSLSERTHTRIEVGGLKVAFPHSIVIQDLFIETLQRDTLLSIRNLSADVNLLDLFSHTITLRHLQVNSLTTHITRTLPDSNFNFDFLLNALGPEAPTSAGPDTSAGPGWAVQLRRLSLRGIFATYDDAVAGLDLTLRLGSLECLIDKSDLEKKQFHIAELSLTNTDAQVVQITQSPPDTSHGADVALGFGTIALANLHLTYDNTATRARYSVDLGTSALQAENIDLPMHRIALKTFTLDDSHIIVRQPKSTVETMASSDGSALPWVISLEHLMLNGNSMRYDVDGAVRTGGFDPQHLRFDDLTLHAENLSLGDHRAAAAVTRMSFREQSGFEVRACSGGFALDSLHAQLRDFTVETPSSRIHQNILLRYPSLSALADRPGNVSVDAGIDDSHIAVSDVLLFLPSFPAGTAPETAIGFSVQLSGLVRELRVEEFRAAAGDSTSLELTGLIRGLPDVRSAYYDLHLHHLSSGREDIRALVADTLLPESLVLPAAIRLSGDFKGTTPNFSAAAVLVTSIGNLRGNVSVTADERPGAHASRWKAEAVAEEFDVGALLGDTEAFGPVSLKASAAGTGLSKDDIEGQLTVQVDKAVVNGYPYRRLVLQGTASPTMFEGKAEMKDSNLAFTFNGTVNTSGVSPKYAFTFDLQGADLQRLRLATGDMRVAGVMTSDLTGRSINDMNGHIDVRNVVIVNNRRRFQLDSLLLVAVNNDTESHISFESPFLAANFDGSIAPGDLPAAIRNHFGRYFSLHDSLPSNAGRPQAFTFRILLRDPRILTDVFVPQLERLNAGVIEGNFDSQKMSLNINANIAAVGYGGYDIDSLSFRVTSDAQRLQSTLRAGSIADSMLHLTQVELSARVAHDSIDMALRSTGGNGETKMLLAGTWSSVPEGYRFRFRPDGIVFGDTTWSVPSDNSITVGSNRFIAHDVVLRDDGQSFSLRSVDSATVQPPLHIDFSQFDLATVSRVIEHDSGLVGGVLNGDIVLHNLFDHIAFTSDLTVQDFTVARRIVGDVVVKANNRANNVYNIRAGITGNNNDFAVHGEYRSTEDANELTLDLDVARISLASIEPFTFGSVQRLSGTMSGGLHVKGTTEKPSITGQLQFAEAACVPALMGSPLRLPHGRIDFDAQGIHFTSFELLDTLGNKASLSGTLVTTDYRDFSFDCRLHTDHFLLLNKSASRDALYYGTLFFDSDIIVSGDLAKPVVRMQSQLDKGTDLALVLPESEADVQQRAGIVRFVDVQHPANPIMSRRQPRTETRRDTTRGRRTSLELTANVEVDKDARLRILIDPIAGDSLVIRGAATFSVVLDPSGKLAVTGRYDIQEGTYQLSFGELIRREFAIQKGSSLTWFGSVTEANVDITAIYTAKTSAIDLVQDQLTGLSQEERNKYKQELRIQVYLMITGNLLEPTIRFRLDLPPDQKGVLGGSIYAKLNELNGQESELNKQVFALLVLGRFISSHPLASASDAGGLSGFARSSVSQILTEQLNRLSEQVITGVKLNVGVESYQDYSSGNAEGRTQLQLALSKALFDERLTVQVGGNVDLEGQRSQHNSLNNFAGDIKVAYKMTEDGRWQLLVFRNNTYGGAIEGDLVETGVGLVFTIDYDKLFGISLTPVHDNKEER